MDTNGSEKNEKNEYKFVCTNCHFNCSYKCDWVRHLKTAKHKHSVKRNITGTENSHFDEKNEPHYCYCGRSYSTKSNLLKHKKKCVDITKKSSIAENEPKMDVYDLVKYLMKENSELKTLLVEHTNKFSDITLELSKNVGHNITNNHNTNSHNKAFNLNFFLNETCKNAMNINDFVDSIKLQLSDFMNVGEVGFVEGISNIIVKKLNSLDETIRPIHCTDQKRETFYVKDENIWEKEEDDRKKINKMIKGVAYKNEKLMKTYKETYPDYNDPDSHRSDQYSKTVIEAMDCKEESREKIIKNISKATSIKSKL